MTTFLLGVVLGSLICTGLPLVIGGFVWRAYRSVPKVVAREELAPQMERLRKKRGAGGRKRRDRPAPRSANRRFRRNRRA